MCRNIALHYSGFSICTSHQVFNHSHTEKLLQMSLNLNHSPSSIRLLFSEMLTAKQRFMCWDGDAVCAANKHLLRFLKNCFFWVTVNNSNARRRYKFHKSLVTGNYVHYFMLFQSQILHWNSVVTVLVISQNIFLICLKRLVLTRYGFLPSYVVVWCSFILCCVL